MNESQKKISGFASKVVADALMSGLSWDEAVGGLGFAAKALATEALHMSGQDDSIAHAHKRLEEGFAQKVQVIFARSDISQLREVHLTKPPGPNAIFMRGSGPDLEGSNKGEGSSGAPPRRKGPSCVDALDDQALLEHLKRFGFEFHFDRFQPGSGYSLLAKSRSLEDFRALLNKTQ